MLLYNVFKVNNIVEIKAVFTNAIIKLWIWLKITCYHQAVTLTQDEVLSPNYDFEDFSCEASLCGLYFDEQYRVGTGFDKLHWHL